VNRHFSHAIDLGDLVHVEDSVDNCRSWLPGHRDAGTLLVFLPEAELEIAELTGRYGNPQGIEDSSEVDDLLCDGAGQRRQIAGSRE